MLIDLEEFCFSQGGFDPPAPCVFSRWARVWVETEWVLHCMEQSESVALKNASLLESVWDQVGAMCLRVCVGLVLSATLDYRSQGLY